MIWRNYRQNYRYRKWWKIYRKIIDIEKNDLSPTPNCQGSVQSRGRGLKTSTTCVKWLSLTFSSCGGLPVQYKSKLLHSKWASQFRFFGFCWHRRTATVTLESVDSVVFDMFVPLCWRNGKGRKLESRGQFHHVVVVVIGPHFAGFRLSSGSFVCRRGSPGQRARNPLAAFGAFDVLILWVKLAACYNTIHSKSCFKDCLAANM